LRSRKSLKKGGGCSYKTSKRTLSTSIYPHRCWRYKKDIFALERVRQKFDQGVKVSHPLNHASFNFRIFAERDEDFFSDERYKDWFVLVGPRYFVVFEFRERDFQATGSVDACRFVV
jgi:hypothetical protein